MYLLYLLHHNEVLRIGPVRESLTKDEMKLRIILRSHEIHRQSATFLDILKEDLIEELNREDDSKCFKTIISIINGAQNFTLGHNWIWDAMQLPTGVLYGSQYQFGNFDECVQAPWKSSHPEFSVKYCLADIRLSDKQPEKAVEVVEVDPYVSTEKYLNELSKYGRELNILTWGVCVPSTCEPQSIVRFLEMLLRHTSLAQAASPSVTLDACQSSEETHQYSRGFYLFWITMLCLVLLTAGCTFYVNIYEDTSKTTSTAMDFAKAFCIIRNSNELVKETVNDIPSMYGIRTIVAATAVFSHQIIFSISAAMANGLGFEKTIDNHFWLFIHTDICVDTFFLMSGLLSIKGLMGKRGQLENPFKVLLKRYNRLIGGLAVTVWFTSSVFQQTGSGPLWERFAHSEAQFCQNNGWLNLLMLNNYINCSEMCFIISWYTAVDFQLTIVGVSLFYLWRRDQRAGLAAATLAAVLAVVLPGLAMYRHGLPATHILNIKYIQNQRQYNAFLNTYIKTQDRMGSYLVGMATGIILSIYKPPAYRNTINMKWSVILIVLSLIIGAICLLGGSTFSYRENNMIEAVFFSATNRIAWAIAIAVGGIIISEYGPPTPLSKLLGWRVWVPLSRLSYGLFLTHCLLIYHAVFSTRAPVTVNIFVMLTYSFGVWVMSYIFSLLMWLLVQAPLDNLTYIMLRRKIAEQITGCKNGATKGELKQTEKNK